MSTEKQLQWSERDLNLLISSPALGHAASNTSQTHDYTHTFLGQYGHIMHFVETARPSIEQVLFRNTFYTQLHNSNKEERETLSLRFMADNTIAFLDTK